MPLTISGAKASVAVAMTPLILHDVYLPETTTKLLQFDNSGAVCCPLVQGCEQLGTKRSHVQWLGVLNWGVWAGGSDRTGSDEAQPISKQTCLSVQAHLLEAYKCVKLFDNLFETLALYEV